MRLAIWRNVAGEDAREADDALTHICTQARVLAANLADVEGKLSEECANSLRLAQDNAVLRARVEALEAACEEVVRRESVGGYYAAIPAREALAVVPVEKQPQ